jgi:hypothetical protein
MYGETDGQWNGKCNLKHGGHLTEHKDKFEAIRVELEKGPIDVGGRDLELGEVGTAEVNEAMARDVMETTSDDDGNVLETVKEFYQTRHRELVAISGESDAQKQCHHSIRTFHSMDKEEEVTQLFVKHWNDLNDYLKQFIRPNPEEEFIYDMMMASHKMMIKRCKNGETAPQDKASLTAKVAVECFKALLAFIKQFDGFSKNPSFRSHLAWTRPTFLVGTGTNKVPQGREEALKRIDKYLALYADQPTYLNLLKERQAAIQNNTL